MVAVPTPVDEDNRPDLTPVIRASETVGHARSRVAPSSSTNRPSTRASPRISADPILERVSGLRAGVDFTLGYSPERINPGDREHTLERITKVVSGQDAATLDRVAAVYDRIIEAGTHRAPSIKVAEAAKVIENTQRDLNIALMNEVALICDRLGIRTADVLAAAGTKWNFLPFSPGLVGGHCIGVDPYYLTTKAEQLGYQPEVILAGRRINNRMGEFIAGKMVKMLINAGVSGEGSQGRRHGADLQGERLRPAQQPGTGHRPRTCAVRHRCDGPRSARAPQQQALHEYGIELCGLGDLTDLDGLILAVPHESYLAEGPRRLAARLRPGGVLIDVKSVIPPGSTPDGIAVWSL